MAFDQAMFRVLPFAIALGSFIDRAAADDLSCQDRIVSPGSSAYEVQTLCGAPDAVAHRTETRTVRRPVSVPCNAQGIGRCVVFVEDTVEVAIDEWTYDFGPQRFIGYVVFEQGNVVAIRAGSYGRKQI